MALPIRLTYFIIFFILSSFQSKRNVHHIEKILNLYRNIWNPMEMRSHNIILGTLNMLKQNVLNELADTIEILNMERSVE
jgi:hypothetical protein